jgi:hypothetical protein
MYHHYPDTDAYTYSICTYSPHPDHATNISSSIIIIIIIISKETTIEFLFVAVIIPETGVVVDPSIGPKSPLGHVYFRTRAGNRVVVDHVSMAESGAMR